MRIVFPRRVVAAAAAALLLFAACSDPQGTEPGDAVATDGTEDGSGDAAGPGDGGATPGGEGEDKGAGKPGSESEPGDGGDGEGSGDGGGSRGSGGGNDSNGGAEGSNDFLAAGDYVYDQKGFERFCQGPRCDKSKLPETATISTSYESRSGNEAVIVTEARSSDRQTMTTTTRHTPGQALITKVVIEFEYGFNFSQTYEPQPPIESLSFPLEVGKSWRGRWKAQTSGDYRVKVVDVSDGVYELATVTNFKGDFSGRAQATVWVDGDTRAIVRTDGDVAVASRFGEYTSSFRTTLRSAPGR